MFRFHKPRDIITLFHKSSSPQSMRVAALLKQVSANASETATEDQASDHSGQTNLSRSDFDLEITEDPPTSDQLRTIIDYVGKQGIQSVVKGAKTENEALRKLKENSENFIRPVVVDWNNGKAHAGDNESEILKMLNALPPKSS
ncbi:hypothetical protein VTK73DRAFT_2720 [Phialemonium thermophilum]|uniref:DUF1687-domain-containing protein n=1 Tax=Phialemonium thermophilum TaxID=223376 RepID=A0ABR3X2V4_9PEZI